jgi:DNA-binding CsgD family transcriptional regulator
MDIADDVQLARVAMASGDDELAELALANARRRASLNPAVASIAATAAHVSGLLRNSPEDLIEATTLFEHGPRRLEYASALEDLGVSVVVTDREAGIDAFGRALAVYVGTGATWDASRVRSRLRDLGVRRRIVPAETEPTGWAAITGSELAVARLVAEGLTNREVAERLFVSPHTVNSHLRHVFAKLGINSRVELARLARDHEQG